MNILIVTYTYPPAKSVNGFRPFYFAQALTAVGHSVTVLTRHFLGNEKHDEYNIENLTPLSITKEEGISAVRLPFKNSWFGYYSIDFLKKTGLWKLIYLLQLLLGRTCQESYNKWFDHYLPLMINKVKFDKVIVESGPTNLVRLVSKYCVRNKIPYIIDFRDAYYHEMYLIDSSRLSLGKKVKINLEERYMHKAIEEAQCCIALSESMHTILKVPLRKRRIITNGYDESKWEIKNNTEADEKIFRITVAGTLYPFSFLDKFLDAIHLFLTMQKESNIEVLFIAPGSESVLTKIKRALKSDRVKIITNRINYRETINWINKSTILAYHGWEGYRGYTSAKIYDYIRSGKKIWIVPADNDVIDEILKDTQAGLSFSDIDQAAHKLSKWYSLWSVDGLIQNTEKDVFKKYSRKYQAEKINEIITDN